MISSTDKILGSSATSVQRVDRETISLEFAPVTKTMIVRSLAIIVAAVCVLYSPFLNNPLIFDDFNFFSGTTPYDYAASTFRFDLRWFAWSSLGWEYQNFGQDIFWLRLGNLALHAATAITLFLFLQRLFDAVLQDQPKYENSLSPMWYAFFGALVFALHPVAVFGAGYLIQRTILMATLFTLLMWLTYLEGLRRDRQVWLIGSAVLYFFAVFSKEHAVMAPAVAAVLTLMLHKPSWALVRKVAPTFLAFTLIAAFIGLRSKGFLGSAYENFALDMLQRLGEGRSDFKVENAYPLSIITQATLFFKYVLLWVVPYPYWMSVDMREPFATGLATWPQSIGFMAYLAYGLLGVWLLLKRGRFGLVGFGMLCPWLLFATELATVRIQESFVLYRSYLWMPGAFAMLPVVLERLSRRNVVVLTIVISALLFPAAYDRLNTFSHPLRLWNDAEMLVRGRQNLPGVDRIYYNRGNQYRRLQLYDLAIADYTRAIEINPKLSVAYGNRGLAYYQKGEYEKAMPEFERTLALNPKNAQAYFGRGLTYSSLGNTTAATTDFIKSCNLGLKAACVQSGGQQKPLDARLAS